VVTAVKLTLLAAYMISSSTPRQLSVTTTGTN